MADNDEIKTESQQEFNTFFAQEGLIHYIGMMHRNGVLPCLEMLEHKHYKPDTPRNDLFILRIITWSDLHWVILSIPKEEKSFMEECARINTLRVVDGTPVMFGGGSPDVFPVSTSDAFTLENIPGGIPTPVNTQAF